MKLYISLLAIVAALLKNSLIVSITLVLALMLAMVTVATADEPPPRVPAIHLTDNRSSGYEVAFTNLIGPLVGCIPPLCTVHAGGRVVAHPKIVNLFWDNDWDKNNTHSPTLAEINGFVQLMTASDYIDQANQYGVFRGNLHSAHGPSTLCQTLKPIGDTDFSSLLGWIMCEVQTPLTGVPLPDDDTIYAVFLPEGVKIKGFLNADCANNYAFHGWAAAVVPDFPRAAKIEGYPYIVIPAQCAVDETDRAATLDNFTRLFSHELIEAALDPFPPTGWIDNFYANSLDVQKWFSTGEPADICQVTATPPDGIPTAPFLRSDGLLVENYWSNLATGCVPRGPATPPPIATLVKDINPAGNGVPNLLTNVNGTVYFRASTVGAGSELWKSDGTEAGTLLVGDINPGVANSSPMHLTNVNGTLFFVADDGTHGRELWKADNTGASMVKDINPYFSLGPTNLTDVNGILFFSADNGVNGWELWRSDGTEAGTVMIKNADPDPGVGAPSAAWRFL